MNASNGPDHIVSDEDLARIETLLRARADMFDEDDPRRQAPVMVLVDEAWPISGLAARDRRGFRGEE